MSVDVVDRAVAQIFLSSTDPREEALLDAHTRRVRGSLVS